ncbi:threonine ammonia-lyase [Sphingomonas canadensis]|uniref:Threonine ammonia-lyase n=1 Tax=Sphingomonas canadensis TaxID=1219257 RepID=A0ABW3H7Y4_9SPHN|nr:threonine ammonia-lyase [Sphingomonas canadensis]MCW3836357.1 threonine ammonia-lyase [Sphingomonas canadensis]
MATATHHDHAHDHPEVTFDDVLAARDRIAGAVVRTPTLLSKTLSELTGAEVYLKFENLQFTAAYKERGALNRLLQLSDEERARGVIAASAGNHAQGLAYHGARLGIPVTIVMPQFTPAVKVQQTASHGARVILHGERFEDAYNHAVSLSEAESLVFAHPFNDPEIIAGQGTVALEMLEDVPDLDCIVVPVGGGGLVSGISLVAHAQPRPVDVIGVQSKRYPAVHNAIKGKDFGDGGDSIAEGIAVKVPGSLTMRIIRRKVTDMKVVSERDIERSISLLLEVEKTVVEGAGAASLAALLPKPNGVRSEFAGRKVGLVLTGGNIDPRVLANVILRDMARTGRLSRIAIILADKAGALHEVTKIFSDCDANILEVSHNRIFGVGSAKETRAEIEFETRDAIQRQALLDALAEAGYRTELIVLK